MAKTMTKKKYHTLNIFLVFILIIIAALQLLALASLEQELRAVTFASAVFLIVAGLGALYTGISYAHCDNPDTTRRGWEPAAILLWLIFQTAYFRYLFTGGNLMLQAATIIEFLLLLLLLISSFFWKNTD